MRNGTRPGRKIGTMDAAEVNHAVDLLSRIVREEGIPPKILVVHRFTSKMLTNASKIRRDPNVQVVIDMDGFGAPSLKRSTWRIVVQRDPVQYTGFKLFYKNDRDQRTKAPGFEPSCDQVTYELVGCGDDGLMTPEQVVKSLFPVPDYIQYQ